MINNQFYCFEYLIWFDILNFLPIAYIKLRVIIAFTLLNDERIDVIALMM